MTDAIEQRVKELLAENGGPPEIALQLIAIAEREMINPKRLLEWILYHTSQDWSASQFAQWCLKYNELLRGLAQNENR